MMLINAGTYAFKISFNEPTIDFVDNFVFKTKKFYRVLTPTESEYFQQEFGVTIASGLYSVIFSYTGMKWDNENKVLEYLGRSVQCTPSNAILEQYLASTSSIAFSEGEWQSVNGEDNRYLAFDNDINLSDETGSWLSDSISPAKLLKAGTYRFKKVLTESATVLHENFYYIIPGADIFTFDMSPGAVTTCTDLYVTGMMWGYFGVTQGCGDPLESEYRFLTYASDLAGITGTPGVEDWWYLYLTLLDTEYAEYAEYFKEFGRTFRVKEDAYVSGAFESWLLDNVEPETLNIYYNNEVVAKLFNGDSAATLSCNGKIMKTDVKIEFSPNSAITAANYFGEYGALVPSEGLSFEAIEGGYKVLDIGACEDTFIVIPQEHLGQPVISIGESAFAWNMQIKAVKFSKNISVIEQGAFSGCINLSNIDFSDSSIKSIGYNSFSSCGIIKIKLPDGLEVIGASAFNGCGNLAKVVFGDGLIDIGDSAFYNCTALTEIELPYGVQTIGSSAFENCSSLKKIKFPNSIETMGSSAFKYCSSLTEVILPPQLPSLEQGVFAHCTNLEKVVMGDNITAIWRVALWNCQKLTDIKMSESIEHIHGKAFGQCYNLTNLSMPDSIKYTMGDPEVSSGNLFDGSSNIVFNIKDNVKYLGNDNNPYALLFKSTGGSTIQPGTKCIGGYAFKNISITSITIPDSVHGISQCAFGGGGLVSVYLPSSIEYLDTNAFSDSVENGHIPNQTIKDIYVPWGEGVIPGAPWGASNATIHYNSEV